MSRPRAEWKGRADFAEFADALGISTTEIMAAMPEEGGAVVVYTPGVAEAEEIDPETPVFRAVLRRGVDGVLFVVARMTTGTLGEMRAEIDRQMEAWRPD